MVVSCPGFELAHAGGAVDLEHVQRTCASLLESWLLLALRRHLAVPRWETRCVTHQSSAATSRNADAILLRRVEHPRMCAVPLPAIRGVLDQFTWRPCRGRWRGSRPMVAGCVTPQRCDLPRRRHDGRLRRRHGTRPR